MDVTHDLNRPRPIRFSIDGRPYSTEDRSQPAAQLLVLAGLDPAGYDLAALGSRGAPPRRFEDDEVVTIKDGDRFVSVRQRAEVA